MEIPSSWTTASGSSRSRTSPAGAILKTDDGGLHPGPGTPINDAQRNANLEGVGFVDARAWLGCAGWGDANFQLLSSSETRDGGMTWRDANEIGKAINRFRFFGRPVTVGYASGENSGSYKYDPNRCARPARQPRSNRHGFSIRSTSSRPPPR